MSIGEQICNTHHCLSPLSQVIFIFKYNESKSLELKFISFAILDNSKVPGALIGDTRLNYAKSVSKSYTIEISL